MKVKRIGRLVGLVLFVLVAVLSMAITATVGWRPIVGAKSRPLTDRKFEVTQARLERGKYLAENVSGCFGCHSKVDWNSETLQSVRGTEGGGRSWGEEGLPWLTVTNITPDKETGAGNWSDDAIARGIREGIGHDGRALFPLMPYMNYREMSDEDLASIVAYLRSIPPVKNAMPETAIPFPVSRLILGAPQPITAPVAPPDFSNQLKRGEYLTRMADCMTCHTADEKGRPLEGFEFAGGFVLKWPKGEIAGPNITPDPSGIGYYTEESFVAAMRNGKIGARKLSPMMPWSVYRGMTDEDLKAVFAYLKTLKPVKHIVDNLEPPSYCNRCQRQHGGGSRN